MAEAHAKNHDYHLVDPSPWPLIGAVSAFLMASGFVTWWKDLTIAGMHLGPFIFGAGIIGVLYTMLSWWTDVVREANTRLPHPRGPASPPLRHDHVHRLRGDVLRRLVLGLFRCGALCRRPAALLARRGARRRLAPEGHRDLRSLAPAAPQHPDPADLGHHGHLGAPRAPARTTARASRRACGSPSSSASSSPASRPTSTATRPSASKATSTAPPSSWRRASTART